MKKEGSVVKISLERIRTNQLMGEGKERANGRGLGDEPKKGASGTIRRKVRTFDWAMAVRMRKDKNKWVNSAIIFGTGSILQLFSKTGSFLLFLPLSDSLSACT